MHSVPCIHRNIAILAVVDEPRGIGKIAEDFEALEKKAGTQACQARWTG